MAAYGPYGPGFAGSPTVSNSAGGAFDISGFPVNSSTAINSDLVKKSFATMVQYLLPRGDATLFGLSAKLKEETAVQIEHGFYSKVLVFPTFQLNATANFAATGWTVVNSGQAIVGGLYKYVGLWDPVANSLSTHDTAMTGEVVQVTASAGEGGTSVTVTRDIGGGGSGTITSAGAYTIATPGTTPAPLFVYIGNAFADAANRPTSVLTKEIRVVNYTQIFRNAWAVSGTVAAIQNLVGDTNISKSRGECAQYHAKDIEASMIFGVGNSSATLVGMGNTGYNGRTMHGIINQIKLAQASGLYLPGQSSSSNITSANSKVGTAPAVATSGALSMPDFENWINNCFDMAYDPSSAMERVLFVGRTSHIVLNRLAALNANYFIENGKTEWGLRFSRLHLTRGDVIVIEHPLFNTNPFWQSCALAVDIASISVAYLTGRKTKSEEYNQSGLAVDNGIDAQGGSLLSELTVLVKNPSGCGIMSKIQNPVKPDGTLFT